MSHLWAPGIQLKLPPDLGLDIAVLDCCKLAALSSSDEEDLYIYILSRYMQVSVSTRA